MRTLWIFYDQDRWNGSGVSRQDAQCSISHGNPFLLWPERLKSTLIRQLRKVKMSWFHQEDNDISTCFALIAVAPHN
jgi:hypothetical protein